MQAGVAQGRAGASLRESSTSWMWACLGKVWGDMLDMGLKSL